MYTNILIKINENIKLFNINNTLQNILSFLTPLLKKHKISIKNDWFTAQYIIGYKNQLSYIFLHILASLINVLKHTSISKYMIIQTQKNKNKPIIMINSTSGYKSIFIEKYYKGETTITNNK